MKVDRYSKKKKNARNTLTIVHRSNTPRINRTDPSQDTCVGGDNG